MTTGMMMMNPCNSILSFQFWLKLRLVENFRVQELDAYKLNANDNLNIEQLQYGWTPYRSAKMFSFHKLPLFISYLFIYFLLKLNNSS